MEAQNASSQDQDGLADEVMNSVGMSTEEASEGQNPNEAQDAAEHDELPKGVKERLGRQEKRHQKEMRQMRADLEAMHGKMSQPNANESSNQPMNPYENTPQAGSVEEQIHKAVNFALQHKEMQECKVEEAKKAAHVAKQYQWLHNHLDDMADKYDDFDETVRGQDAPFTNHMRDASLLLPKSGPGSAGEVLYKLGRNKSELERIAKLYPLDQASEMVKLSHALMGGSEQKGSNSRPMGNIKSNPVTNTAGITDKTPVSELRKQMRAGWK